MSETLKELLDKLSQNSFQGINEKGKNGNTVLHLAAELPNYETVKLLIEKGANVNARNNKGETPLHRAALMRHVENAKVLIAGGADINATTNIDDTPIHLASLTNAEAVVEELIRAGANVNSLNKFGTSPMYYAKPKSNLAKLLEENGGKVIDKIGEANNKMVDMYQGTMGLLDRLALPELMGKVVSLDEIKKRDESLLEADFMKLYKSYNDLINEVIALRKKDDEEKD